MARQKRDTREAPEVEPLDVDGVRTVAIMTVLWGVAFVVLAIRRAALEVDGNGWWLWTCLAGVGLGLLGLEYTRKRRDAIAHARLRAEAEADEDDIVDVETAADVADSGPAPLATQPDQTRPPEDARPAADTRWPEDTRPPEDVRRPEDVRPPQTRPTATGQQPVVAPGSALPRRRPPVAPDSLTRPIETTAPHTERPLPDTTATQPAQTPSGDTIDSSDHGLDDDSYQPRRARSSDSIDDDQPLIETTLGGTQRPVRREDVNEEDDDITEGGTVYRGRRARRRRRDSA